MWIRYWSLCSNLTRYINGTFGRALLISSNVRLLTQCTASDALKGVMANTLDRLIFPFALPLLSYFSCWIVFKTICWLIALFVPIIVCCWSKFHCANHECLIYIVRYNLVEVMAKCIWNILYDNHSWLISSHFMKVGSRGNIRTLLYSYISYEMK